MIHWTLQRGDRDPGAPGEPARTAAERTRLAAFRVGKRAADWLAGRLAAKSVVAAALARVAPGDWPLRAIEIGSEPSGRPYAAIAPDAGPVGGFAPGTRLPITVSISHAGGHALCAAAWSDPAGGWRRSLGVDLGEVEPRSREFVAGFLTADERRFVQDGPRDGRGLRANLIWCAKEAVLKALGVGLTVDTYALSCLPAPGAVDRAEWPLSPDDPGWHPFVATCTPVLGRRKVRGIWRSFPGLVAALSADVAPAEAPLRTAEARGEAPPGVP